MMLRSRKRNSNSPYHNDNSAGSEGNHDNDDNDDSPIYNHETMKDGPFSSSSSSGTTPSYMLSSSHTKSHFDVNDHGVVVVVDDNENPSHHHHQHNQHQHQSIVPVWGVVLVVVMVFLLGYTSNHYQLSRGVDHYQFHSTKLVTGTATTFRKEAERGGGGGGGMVVGGGGLKGKNNIVQPSIVKASTTTTHSAGKSLLSSEEDDQLEYDETGQRYHVIFSTDCSPYQQWQR
jgi:hypothetical protein